MVTEIDFLRNSQFQEAINAMGHVEGKRELATKPSRRYVISGQGTLSAGILLKSTSFIGVKGNPILGIV